MALVLKIFFLNNINNKFRLFSMKLKQKVCKKVLRNAQNLILKIKFKGAYD